MTTDFLHRNRAGVLLTLFAGISVVLLTLRVDPYVNAIKKMVWFFVAPEVTLSGQFFNRLDNVRGRVFSLGRAEGENYLLRRQNAALSKGVVERDVLQAENDRLRRLLDLREKRFFDGIAANVLAHEPREWFHTILLNKGKEAGVELYAAVVEGTSDTPRFLGRVVDVTAKTSKVLLITDVDSAVSVEIRNKGDLGLLEGRNGPLIDLNYLSQQSKIEKGDEVVTAGLGGIIPPGLLVGSVANVVLSADGFFKEAQIVPVSDFYSVRDVLIVSRKEGVAP